MIILQFSDMFAWQFDYALYHRHSMITIQFSDMFVWQFDYAYQPNIWNDGSIML